MSGGKLIAVIIENIDLLCVRVPCAYIGVLEFSGLKKIGKTKYENMPWYSVEHFVISVDREFSDSPYCVLDGEHIDGDGKDYLLKFNRIISVDRIYEDGMRDRVETVWYDKKIGANIYDPKYMNFNYYQHSKINKHGDLFIEVGKALKLDNIFPNEAINSDDYRIVQK